MDFHCAGCGYSTPVKVEEKGAAQSLELCPCPKCGWRNPLHTGEFERRSTSSTVISCVILLGGLVLLGFDLWTVGGALAGIGLAAVVVVRLRARSVWNAAARNVRFPAQIEARAPANH
jgi:hypothetical protein